MKKIRKAVIPAAGYGTRFLPFTKSVPKEMLPIIDRPTIEYIVREAIDSGIEEVLIIINKDKNCIKEHFSHNKELEELFISKNKLEELNIITSLPNEIKVSFAYQNEQLGLGHAVLCAHDFVKDEPFALLLGDDVYVGKNLPVLKQMINAYEKTGASILGTLYVGPEDISKYGVCDILPGESGSLLKLASVIEKPTLEEAPSSLAIGGRYILDQKIFDYLRVQERGYGGEIQLTDSILKMMSEKDVYALIVEGERYDLGSKKGFLEATIDFALSRDDLKDVMIDILNKKVFK